MAELGGRNQHFLCIIPVCSVSQTFTTVEENTIPPEPLVNISVPKDHQVTLGPLSTPPDAFEIVDNQLFLNVTPDYEVQAAGRMDYAFMETYMGIHSSNLEGSGKEGLRDLYSPGSEEPFRPSGWLVAWY